MGTNASKLNGEGGGVAPATEQRSNVINPHVHRRSATRSSLRETLTHSGAHSSAHGYALPQQFSETPKQRSFLAPPSRQPATTTSATSSQQDEQHALLRENSMERLYRLRREALHRNRNVKTRAKVTCTCSAECDDNGPDTRTKKRDSFTCSCGCVRHDPRRRRSPRRIRTGESAPRQGAHRAAEESDDEEGSAAHHWRTSSCDERDAWSRSSADGVFELDAEVVPPREVLFQWIHGGREVHLTGGWDGWSARLQMVPSGGEHALVIRLPCGTHQYRFLVDGEPVHAPEQPTATDEYGTVANVVTVNPPKHLVAQLPTSECTHGINASVPLVAAEDPLALDSASGLDLELARLEELQGGYGQLMSYEQAIASRPPPPPQQSVSSAAASLSAATSSSDQEPPKLPPHLLRALLNASSSRDDPHVLPLPHHVILNHLYSMQVSPTLENDSASASSSSSSSSRLTTSPHGVLTPALALSLCGSDSDSDPETSLYGSYTSEEARHSLGGDLASHSEPATVPTQSQSPTATDRTTFSDTLTAADTDTDTATDLTTRSTAPTATAATTATMPPRPSATDSSLSVLQGVPASTRGPRAAAAHPGGVGAIPNEPASEMVIMGLTHRYRDKFVTNVFYKRRAS